MWKNTLSHAANALKQGWTQTATVVTATPPKAPATGLARLLDEATTTLGRNLRELSQSIEHPTGPVGISHAATFSASHGLDSAGKYLERQGFDGVARDLGETVKKNPLPVMGLCLGVGILVGRLLAPRRS